jgi:predicted nucleic acid-binding Zn ribbon protein
MFNTASQTLRACKTCGNGVVVKVTLSAVALLFLDTGYYI